MATTKEKKKIKQGRKAIELSIANREISKVTWSQLQVTGGGHRGWSQVVVTGAGHRGWSQGVVTAAGHRGW